MKRAKISGVGHYVPENVVSNNELATRMTTSDEWIRERSGIQERRYFTPGKDTVANMAAKAATIALDRAGVGVEEIDFIIFATLSPDYYFPGSGVLLQRELGITDSEIAALDIRAQCSGFLYSLSVAEQFIKTGKYKNILVCGSEIHSSGLDYSDEGRNVTVLFGDGAGAVLVQPTDEEEKGILTTHMHSNGEHAEQLMVKGPNSHRSPNIDHESLDEKIHFPVMNGRYVFKLAVEKFPEVIMEALKETGYTPQDIDLFIPHQANLRISEAVRQVLGLPKEKVFNNIMRYGNTTAATIPICMSEAFEAGKIKEGDLICLAAFGSGFTWASALIRW